MSLGSARAPSPDGTGKKTDTLDTIEEPNKLQGYGSVPGVMDEVTRVVDHKAERRLCRKFDYRLLPILAVMCESTRFQSIVRS
jgi:hypothetical protein